MNEVFTIETGMNAPRKNISQVIKEYSSRLFRFIRGRVDTQEDAEDVLQDVWYQFSSIVDTEPIEQASAWLFKVARNKIIDRHRKQKHSLLGDELVYDEDEGGLSFEQILLTEAINPETENLRNLFWQQLFEALNELPEEQRQVFIWHELEDISFNEISERTGANVNTLISRKRYAILHLRDRLKKLYDELINQ